MGGDLESVPKITGREMEPPFWVHGQTVRLWPRSSIYTFSGDKVTFHSPTPTRALVTKITANFRERLSPQMPPNSVVFLSDDTGPHALYSDREGALSKCLLEEIGPVLGELAVIQQPITIPLDTKLYAGGVIQERGREVTIYRFDGHSWEAHVSCEPFDQIQSQQPSILPGKIRLVRDRRGELSLWTGQGEVSFKEGVTRFKPEQFYGVQYDEIEFEQKPILPPGAVVLGEDNAVVYSVVNGELTLWQSDDEKFVPCWVTKIAHYDPIVHQIFDNQAMVRKTAFILGEYDRVMQVQISDHKLTMSDLSIQCYNLVKSEILPEIPTIPVERRPKDRLVVAGGCGHYQGMRIPVVRWLTKEQDDLKRLSSIFGVRGEVALVYSNQQGKYCLLIRDGENLRLIPCAQINQSLNGKIFVRRLPKESIPEVDPYPPLDALPMYPHLARPSLAPNDIGVWKTANPSFLKVEVCHSPGKQARVIYTFDVPIMPHTSISSDRFREGTPPTTSLIFWDLSSSSDNLKICYHNSSNKVAFLSFAESIAELLRRGISLANLPYEQFLVES